MTLLNIHIPIYTFVCLCALLKGNVDFKNIFQLKNKSTQIFLLKTSKDILRVNFIPSYVVKSVQGKCIRTLTNAKSGQ